MHQHHPTPDELVERFSRLTHSPRGPLASGEETYRQLLHRLPKDDRPVRTPRTEIAAKRHWGAAASIALVVGIGLVLAGVYRFRTDLFPSSQRESVDVPASTHVVQTLVFDDAPLSEIVQSLTDAYQVPILIKTAELSDYRLTATFTTQEPLPEVLAALCEVGGFSYEASGEGYVIYCD